MALPTIGTPSKPLIADKSGEAAKMLCADPRLPRLCSGLADAPTAFCRPPSVLLSVAVVPLLPTALLTAKVCCPCPAGLVVSAGGVNGASVAAAAEALA